MYHMAVVQLGAWGPPSLVAKSQAASRQRRLWPLQGKHNPVDLGGHRPNIKGASYAQMEQSALLRLENILAAAEVLSTYIGYRS